MKVIKIIKFFIFIIFGVYIKDKNGHDRVDEKRQRGAENNS
jgi:hypothetical protein